MIGTILGNRYKIIAELGSGGMAWVYLAEDLVEDQQVAVKVLYPQHGHDVSFLQRFMQEAKLAMSLSQCAPQRQIVCVLDYGSDRDTHYLVMELVPGQDLGTILEQEGALPWQTALQIARQVALALEHADQYDIVHRDIKPGNIMILPEGDVRVLDFGIAKARTSPHLTLGGFVGSPHYSAPEQAMGEPVDIRADLYSLGVVIYRMLSGGLPFQGNTPWAVVNQHLAAPPPPLRDTCPDLPPRVSGLVERAMAKRPEDRFQTPAEMAEAIEEILADKDLSGDEPVAAPVVAPERLDELYLQARSAAELGAWQEAISNYSQIVRLNPDYRDVAEQITVASEQLRTSALYDSARRALELGQWDHALSQLYAIAGTDPEYRDIRLLRDMAERKEPLKDSAGAVPGEFQTQVDGHGPIPVGSTAGPGDGAIPLDAGPPAEKRGMDRRLLLLAIPILILAMAVASILLLRNQPGISSGAATSTPASSSQSAAATPLPTGNSVGTARTETIQVTALPAARTHAPDSGPVATATPPPSPSGALQPVAGLTFTPVLTTSALLTPTVTQPPPPSATPHLPGQLAFPRYDPERQTYDVHVCRLDGKGCRRVASQASQPDFLPDGNQLVVHSWKPDDKGLVLQDVSGQRIWKISDTIESARPAVDWEGKIYAYHSREESDRQPRLHRTYGPETRPIVREASVVLGQAPSWLPDGQILYSGCWRDSCGILVMESDGTFPRQIAAGSTETNPESSPDGRRVAFMSQRDGNWEIYIVSVDGSGLQRLTRNPANDGLPTWSPDGSHIAFVSNRDGRWAVWVMSPDGSDQRRLFGIGGPLEGDVTGAVPHELHGWVEERLSWSPVP